MENLCETVITDKSKLYCWLSTNVYTLNNYSIQFVFSVLFDWMLENVMKWAQMKIWLLGWWFLEFVQFDSLQKWIDLTINS